MQKILLVINAHKPDLASIDFACRIAASEKTKLTGLLIDNLYFEYAVALYPEKRYHFNSANEKRSVAAVTVDAEEAIRLFKKECQLRGVTAEVLIDTGEPIQEVLYESRYADLLLLDPSTSFYDTEEQVPSHFVRELLTYAECPVLLTPQRYEDIDEIIFCYDGSASSVFAIKQFTYLLPAFNNKNVLLLEVNEPGNIEFNDSHRRMMEWLKSHYHSAYYQALHGKVKDELFTYLFLKTNRMVVMGAYGRGMLSQFFKRSSADRLMRMVDLPLFITHY